MTVSNKILERMLERLRASLTSGPLLGCRPHSSRQRIDLTQLARLEGPRPEEILPLLIGAERSAKLTLPKTQGAPNGGGVEGKPARDEYQTLWTKLRAIAEDARTYEQDTGVHALFIGYPVLHLPPAARGVGGVSATKRILAPLAFVPAQLTLRATRPPSLTLDAVADGSDLVVPNVALLAWVEQVTGRRITEEFEDDEGGADPWKEINDITTVVCRALGMSAPAPFAAGTPLTATPRSDAEDAKTPAVLSSAVLGLFPVSNQGLMRDLEALVDGEPAVGPIESFITSGSELGMSQEGAALAFDIAADRCVSRADPCQARAVRLARCSSGLVVHGPPGTGKSQTITNIIADHLANGERVLFVCDKRTALDVVQYRLQHLGLGQLCAVVHDAQRDQRDLYLSIREQLDGLSEGRIDTTVERALVAADEELRSLHRELSEYASAVSDRPATDAGYSFHELTGAWFSIDVPELLAAVPEIRDVDLARIRLLERDTREVLERGIKESFPSNPWTSSVGITLADYLAHPYAYWESMLHGLDAAARGVDDAAGAEGLPFDPSSSIAEQTRGRTMLAEGLAAVLQRGCSAELARWAAVERAELERTAQDTSAVAPLAASVESEPLDRELLPAIAGATPPIQELSLWLGKLASYLQIATKWYRFFFFGRRREALGIVQRFGLALGLDTATRVRRVLDGLRARQTLQGWYARLFPAAPAGLLSDPTLTKAVADSVTVFRVLSHVNEEPSLSTIRQGVMTRLQDATQHAALLAELRASEARAGELERFATAQRQASLLTPTWHAATFRSACEAREIYPEITALVKRHGTVEGILRIRERLESASTDTRRALEWLLERGAAADAGWAAVEKAGLSAELGRRLSSAPVLHKMDAERVRASYDRYRALEQRRRALARDHVLQRWRARQGERLCASTGTRLNAAGAEVRRRLVTRGERALRLRQVVAAGGTMEGGDPLFDLRPVWMTSPEVAAQIFPRAPLFDVVVFDEASQCRLEEALPVLTRARRVVIAGDPKQLPPSRFFESAVTQSQDEDAETEQELFEAQQSEVEDLLGAALNLSIEQAYLDVHYRSQNADLIEFSNESFYESRLQAIPAHPSNRSQSPPLELTHVGGVYEKRANPKEAEHVVRVVRRLLADKAPPSIGIACFNLTQRDAIVEALDRAAAGDPEFAERLAAARARRGTASFEGLFVKNLENVQGDERDHMIISTTYGPDPAGRFYRRFGPLGQAGGGRRLNVLVTRARQKVHILTSIPQQAYRALPSFQAGQQPNGAWLLFSYLNYAERLAAAYSGAAETHAQAAKAPPMSRIFPSKMPSTLAAALGKHLASAQAASNDVHWGNDGFCVDTALAHPTRVEDVTIGVLCDSTRFDKAPDRVQWDIFRTEILEVQGWQFFRLWSPQLFRDPKGTIAGIMREAQRWLAQQQETESARVEETRAERQLLN